MPVRDLGIRATFQDQATPKIRELRKEVGDKLPQAEREARKETDRLTRSQKEAARAAKQQTDRNKALTGGLGKLAVGLGIGIVSFQGLKSAIGGSLSTSLEHEQAMTRLSQAGFRNVAQVDAQAEALQRLSGVSSDVIANQIAIGKALGQSEELAIAYARAALDASAAIGRDFVSVHNQLNKTMGGVLGELAELIPAMKSLTVEELKAGKAADFLNDAFGGAAEAFGETRLGRINKAKTSFEDAQQAAGDLGFVVLDLSGAADIAAGNLDIFSEQLAALSSQTRDTGPLSFLERLVATLSEAGSIPALPLPNLRNLVLSERGRAREQSNALEAGPAGRALAAIDAAAGATAVSQLTKAEQDLIDKRKEALAFLRAEASTLTTATTSQRRVQESLGFGRFQFVKGSLRDDDRLVEQGPSGAQGGLPLFGPGVDLRSVAASGPTLDETMDKLIKKGEEFGNALREDLDEAIDQTNALEEAEKQAARAREASVARFGESISGALLQGVIETGNLAEGFKSMTTAVLSHIQQELAKQLGIGIAKLVVGVATGNPALAASGASDVSTSSAPGTEVRADIKSREQILESLVDVLEPRFNRRAVRGF